MKCKSPDPVNANPFLHPYLSRMYVQPPYTTAIGSRVSPAGDSIIRHAQGRKYMAKWPTSLQSSSRRISIGVPTNDQHRWIALSLWSFWNRPSQPARRPPREVSPRIYFFCASRTANLLRTAMRCRDHLSSGEKRAGCADLVTCPSMTFFSV
jgi:hypothetical protein